MNRVIAAVIENASVAMSDNEAAAKKARPITLRDAVAHVRLVNRAATQWREIMHEGIGLKALLRDELSHILDIALDTPCDVSGPPTSAYVIHCSHVVALCRLCTPVPCSEMRRGTSACTLAISPVITQP